MKKYYVYFLTNWSREVLYIGMTNNLERRLNEHKSRRFGGFTKKYNLDRLVYFEETQDVSAALVREKQLKGWKRDRKNALVTQMNPDWIDFAAGEREDPSLALRMTRA